MRATSYLTTSKIAQKISGYMENLEEKAQHSSKQMCICVLSGS